MKTLFTTVLFLSGLLFNSNEPEVAEFELSFSYYNHAGQTVYSYRLEGNQLKVTSNWLYGDSAYTDLYTVTLNPATIATLQSIKLDALKDHYFNNCIMITSGNEYFISAGYGNAQKEIHLHCYYKEEIAQLVAELNKVLPEEHQIGYEEKDTKQDCK